MEHVIKIFMICLAGIIPLGGFIYLIYSFKTAKIITREPSKLLTFKTVTIIEDRKAFWVSWSAFFFFFLAILIIIIFQSVTKWELPLRDFITN
jgi:hypothetical protein